MATRPPRSYTFRPVWIAGKHGVMAASDKAQKSWDAADAAVSGASGTAWLGVFPCEAQGPVVIFWGEGDDEDLVLRLRAIAKSRDLELDDLPIRVCLRVPHLTDQEQLAIVRAELLATQPTLVILDPLYLAVGGARSSDLVEMGGALEAIQHLTQAVRASLLVLHHFRKGGSGTDRDRMSGAGPAAWGRVLVSIHVTSRRTEPDGASIVTRRLAFIGDAISDLTIVVRRRIRKINPDTASSPYEYEIEQLEEDELAGDEALPPSARRVLSVLDAARHSLKVREIGDQLAEAGHPLKRRTIQEALALLDKMERAKGFGDPAQGLEWVSITAETSDQPPVEEPNAF
ncbi:MAG: AAA family ATPase [Actinomycetota bacterium]